MSTNVLDLSKVTERREIAAVSETAGLLQILDRASRDPAVDVVKLRELWALRKEIAAEAAETAFNDAMNGAQAEMTPIATDAVNPQTHSKYATYGKLDGKLRPIYTRHGFSISFNEGKSDKEKHVLVLAYVSHRAGHTRTYQADMPADGKGAKGGDVMTETHAVGAAKSYGKRYILKDVFNIAIGEEDTDGNDPYPRITERQAADLKALITEHGGNLGKLLKYFKVGELAEIHANNYEWTVGEIKRLAKAASEARAK